MSFGRQHIGKHARLKRDLRTHGGTEFKAGEELLIRHWHRKFYLEAADGREIRLYRNDFDLVERSDS
jgi:hypothetical protein